MKNRQTFYSDDKIQPNDNNHTGFFYSSLSLPVLLDEINIFICTSLTMKVFFSS